MKSVCVVGPDGSGKTLLIPEIARTLMHRGVSVDVVKTTVAIAGNKESAQWRKALVAKDTSPKERFEAAYNLYNANVDLYMANNPSLPMVLLIERGFSSMVTYNRVDEWSLEYQRSIIPSVDIPVYVDAPFDHLSRRLKKRKTTDFQDVDTEYRQRVWKEGIRDFMDLCSIRKLPGFVVDNEDGSFDQSLDRIVAHIFRNLYDN